MTKTVMIAHGSAAVQAARIIAMVADEREEIQRQRILKIRDEQGLGIYEAKRIVEKEDLVADIHAASSIEDIKSILLRAVK